MSHPFGDLLSQHLHCKHGLSQSKLAEGILQAPAIITDMCKGKRLTGPQARERVLQIIAWLQQQGVLNQVDEANALLTAAGLAALQGSVAIEQTLLTKLAPTPKATKLPDLSKPRPAPLATRTPPRHLPAQLTPLIGRTQDLAIIQKRLLHEGHRLLTLVGPPGVGKTRLATQAAVELAGDFADGVFFVQLATVRDAALAPALLCQALGLQESNLPPLEHLKLYLADKRILLVLDNLEQILAIAPLLVELLTACPQLYLLTTSRAPLRVRAERQFPVAPLAVPPLDHLPDAEDVRHYSAITLFLERSQAVQPDFGLTPANATAVATLCTRLDGLPLAIELIAARIKLLSPAALLKRLDSALLLSSDGLQDSTPRQQTLRDAIRWSYDLLTPPEQRLFTQLGIFAGGFTLEAAEALCIDFLPERSAVLAGIASLVDKSLLYPITQHSEPRFGMLETIHEYALEVLGTSGSLAAVQRCHAEFYLQLAEMAEPYLRTGEQIIWLKQLDAERANWRAALTWCVSEAGDPVLGLRLANALGYYWYLRALYGEGSRWFDTLLAQAGEQAPVELQAWALYNNCLQAVGLDDIARGLTLGEAAQAFAYSLNDQWLLAYLLLPLSQHIFCRHGRAQRNTLLNEGLAVARTLNDAWLINAFFTRLTFSERDLAQRTMLNHEALVQARLIGDRNLTACALENLGATASQRGDSTQASACYEEALQLARELDDKRNMLGSLLFFGDLAYMQGHIAQTAAYYQEALLIAQQMGTPGMIGAVYNYFGWLAKKQSQPLEALRYYQAGLRIVQPFGHRLFVAPCLMLIATLTDMPNTPLELSHATRLYGAATAIFPFEAMLLEPTDLPDIEHTVTTIRSRLDEPHFAKAWAEGQAMTLDEAIAYALALEFSGFS